MIYVIYSFWYNLIPWIWCTMISYYMYLVNVVLEDDVFTLYKDILVVSHRAKLLNLSSLCGVPTPFLVQSWFPPPVSCLSEFNGLEDIKCWFIAVLCINLTSKSNFSKQQQQKATAKQARSFALARKGLFSSVWLLIKMFSWVWKIIWC